MFAAEEEEKENKSRKSPGNQRARASAAVIPHSYVTFRWFHREPQSSTDEKRGCLLRSRYRGETVSVGSR